MMMSADAQYTVFEVQKVQKQASHRKEVLGKKGNGGGHEKIGQKIDQAKRIKP
jgi:hypothetical protein